MMIANIYKDGEYVNRIVADEEFAAAYCAENGYTYELEPDPPEPVPEPVTAYTADDLFGALLGLEDNSSGGGVIFSSPVDFLLALGPERYDRLSRWMRGTSSPAPLRGAPSPEGEGLRDAPQKASPLGEAVSPSGLTDEVPSGKGGGPHD